MAQWCRWRGTKALTRARVHALQRVSSDLGAQIGSRRNLFTATSLRSMLGKSNCTLTTPLGDEGERSTAGEYGRKGPTADDELTAFPRYVFFPGKSPGDDTRFQPPTVVSAPLEAG